MFQISKIVIIYQPTLFSEQIGKLNLLLHSEGCRPVCSFIHLKHFPVCHVEALCQILDMRL